MFRLGHIKGSKNLTWTNLLDKDNKFLYDGELLEVFKHHGIIINEKPIIATCQSGKTATVLSVALDLLGIESTLYDGSYLEFSSRLD